MNKTFRILLAFIGISLAFLIGSTAIAAENTAKLDAQPQLTYAPGLPSWMTYLPADKQEIARKIWLTEGRAIFSLRETMQAKRHELNALQNMPNPDEKAVAAVTKDMGAMLEKLLMAQFAFQQKLEKEGIPTWRHPVMGPMMGGMDGDIMWHPVMGLPVEWHPVTGRPMVRHPIMGSMMAPQ